jgi:hypothetical protein
LPEASNTWSVYAPGARVVSMPASALFGSRANAPTCAKVCERALVPPQPLFCSIIVPDDEKSWSAGVAIVSVTSKAESPGPTARRSTVFGPVPAITNPAIIVWLPFSWSREERFSSRSVDDPLMEKTGALDEPIVIMRVDVVACWP